MTPLAGWQNFYVIVGSSAGALIGLQFVVLSLISNRPMIQEFAEASSVFSTPTIVHFGAVLMLSGLLCIPWPGVAGAAVAWGLMGLCGLVYIFNVTRRLRSQTAYRPEFEDWLFHTLLPGIAYAMLVLSACTAGSHDRAALFAVGAAALFLLFIGIHNAWDTITYHVFVVAPQIAEDRKEGTQNGN